MFQKILVAYNESPESRAALQACLRLAPGPETEVHRVGIMNVGTYLMAGEHVCEGPLGSASWGRQENCCRNAVTGGDI